MKIISNIILLLLAINAYAENIPFNGKHVNVIGSFIRLEINGTDDKGTVEIITKNQNSKSVDHAIVGDELRLALTGEISQYIIRMPKQMNIQLHPVPVIFEDSKYTLDSYLPVSISNLHGQVSFLGDGYNIQLIENTSDISVVTYGNIQMKSTETIGELISLDTYQGVIDVKIPADIKNSIRANAKNGSLQIDEAFKNNITNTPLKPIDPLIHLNSEKGEKIIVKNVSKKDSITHPELRDQLIKMYLEDQGKQLISEATEADLRAEGYGDFIDALPQIPNWHRDYKDKHEKQLRAIFTAYGLPTKEMIGDYCAYNMVILAFIQYKSIRNEFRHLAEQAVNPEVFKLLEKSGR